LVAFKFLFNYETRIGGERVEFVSLVPALVLPDLVEAHIAQLELQPIFIGPNKVIAPPALTETEHLAKALEQVYEFTHTRSGSNLLGQSNNAESFGWSFIPEAFKVVRRCTV
jgi:hypothetical protein